MYAVFSFLSCLCFESKLSCATAFRAPFWGALGNRLRGGWICFVCTVPPFFQPFASEVANAEFDFAHFDFCSLASPVFDFAV